MAVLRQPRSQHTADEAARTGEEDIHAHLPARGVILIHATSNWNGPACLSEIRKPTEVTFAGSSGGWPESTRPRKVGTKSFIGRRNSSHSPGFVGNEA